MNPVVVQADNIPFLFDSTPLVFNTGNNDSKIFYFAVEQAAVEACEETDAHSHILNCCFKGGCPPDTIGIPRAACTLFRWRALSEVTYMKGRAEIMCGKRRPIFGHF